MTYDGSILAVGSFTALLGALVFLARPGRRLNQLLGAMLWLQGIGDLAFEWMRHAPNPAAALDNAFVGTWFQLTVDFLLIHIVIVLLAPEKRPRWLQAILAINWAAFVVIVAWAALDRQLIVAGIGGERQYHVLRAWPRLPTLEAGKIADLVAVLGGTWVASRPHWSKMRRRQGALVAAASAVLVAEAAAVSIGLVIRDYPGNGWIFRLIEPYLFSMDLLGLAVVLAATPMLLRAFDGRARTALALVIGASVASGLLVATYDWLYAVGLNNPRTSARLIWVTAFALFMALAVTRYELAGFDVRMRRHVTRLGQLMFVAAALFLPAGVVLAFQGGHLSTIVVPILAATLALSLTPGALKVAARAMGSALTLPATDPLVQAHRASVYAAALKARNDNDLSRLRRQLSISDSEHLLLLNAVEQDRSGNAALLGRYSITKELGRGAHGSALLAVDHETGENVVIKRFHLAGAAKRARREAGAMRRIQHPNVVRLLGLETAADEVFLVLAHAAGGSLHARIQASGPLPANQAVPMFVDVLAGLEAVHEAGLVHADVKPANILLDADGRAMLGDFGAARFTVADPNLTLTGAAVAATMATVAPEVLQGGDAEPASDVFGAAASLYRALTGEHYVNLATGDAFAARQAILSDPARLPHPAVPAAIEGALSAALHKNPAQRPTVTDLRAQLARFNGRETAESTAPPTPRRRGQGAATNPA